MHFPWFSACYTTSVGKQQRPGLHTTVLAVPSLYISAHPGGDSACVSYLPSVTSVFVVPIAQTAADGPPCRPSSRLPACNHGGGHGLVGPGRATGPEVCVFRPGKCTVRPIHPPAAPRFTRRTAVVGPMADIGSLRPGITTNPARWRALHIRPCRGHGSAVV